MKPALLLGAVLLAGCAATPGPPLAPGQRPAIETAEAGLWYQVDQIEKELRSSPLRVRDADLNAYLHDLVCELKTQYCADLRIYVLDVPGFNAAMFPNGAMLVYTGLLLRVQNEAQLAFVLGHEVGHFELRHTLARWRQVDQTGNLVNLLSVLSAGAGVPLAAVAVQLGAIGVLQGYSREQEREADAYGLATLLDHRYDGREAPKVFANLLAEEQANTKRGFSAFASHPPTAERLEALSAQAQGGPTTDTRRDGDASLARLRLRFRGDWLADELARRNFGQSEVLLERLAASEAAPDLDYFRAELFRKRALPGDAERAEALYRQAITAPDAPPAALRELGLIARQRGAAEAHDWFRRYLAAAPDAPDRALIESYLDR